MSLALRLTGAEVLRPGGLDKDPLAIAEGRIVEHCQGREVDLSGFLVLPGIVDIHGDGFERHLAPRRGAMKDLDQGLVAAEAELAANGVTTAVLAQFYSWEGGMRGPHFAARVLEALEAARPRLDTELHVQLRFEIALLEHYEAFAELVERHRVGYVVFNDHLPHDALIKGKRPPRLTGQALRIGRDPERHFRDLLRLEAGMTEVPAALTDLVPRLAARRILLGSHDDRSARDRERWHQLGVGISEFPETAVAAETARRLGDGIILGAPNLARGGSHKGNVSALDLVAMELCDALASDYHYPSLRRAAFLLVDAGLCAFPGAWRKISSGPARMLGLDDRGELLPGQRADIVVLNSETRDVCATLSAGHVTFLRAEAAQRFLA